MSWSSPRGVRGVMAAKRRLKRKERGRGKRLPPVVKPRKRTASPGVVEEALAVFAHEVRTPLTGILAISDLLATSDLGERERRWVDTIKAGAEHLASLATLFVHAANGRNTATGLRGGLFALRLLAPQSG